MADYRRVPPAYRAAPWNTGDTFADFASTVAATWTYLPNGVPQPYEIASDVAVVLSGNGGAYVVHPGELLVQDVYDETPGEDFMVDSLDNWAEVP